jgi:hypothetical protein
MAFKNRLAHLLLRILESGSAAAGQLASSFQFGKQLR